MKTLMIHECTDAHVEYDYSDHVLTFDDGLYTQYKYLDFWRTLPNRRIFFITPTIICNSVQDTSFITAPDAHEHYFATSEANHYMTLNQIRELLETGIEIGIHGYRHERLTEVAPTILEQQRYLNHNINTAILWFKSNFGIIPNTFCHPYNDSTHLADLWIKSNFGMEVYGEERTELLIKENYVSR